MDKIEIIQKRLRRDAEKWHDKTISEGAKGALTGWLNKLAGEDSMRRLILYTWFRQQDDEIESISSKDLTEGEWYAINELANQFKYEGQWLVSAKFRQFIDQTKAYIIYKLS